MLFSLGESESKLVIGATPKDSCLFSNGCPDSFQSGGVKVQYSQGRGRKRSGYQLTEC